MGDASASRLLAAVFVVDRHDLGNAQSGSDRKHPKPQVEVLGLRQVTIVPADRHVRLSSEEHTARGDEVLWIDQGIRRSKRDWRRRMGPAVPGRHAVAAHADGRAADKDVVPAERPQGREVVGQPFVVGVERGDPRLFTSFDTRVARRGGASVASVPYHPRSSPLRLLSRAIIGSVINHDHLRGRMGLLAQRAAHGPPHEVFAIEDRDHHGNGQRTGWISQRCGQSAEVGVGDPARHSSETYRLGVPGVIQDGHTERATRQSWVSSGGTRGLSRDGFPRVLLEHLQARGSIVDLATDSGSRASSGVLRVGICPPVPVDEPASYLSLLRASLSQLGVKVINVASPSPSWALGAREDVDVLHLHWLEFISPSQRAGRLRRVVTLLRGARLCVTLVVLRARGVGVVWTVHNLAPHEPVHPTLERLLARLVLALANRTIVHSDYAASRVAETLGATKRLQVVPHGNYIGVFPEDHRPQACLRHELGLPIDGFVYLAFGQVRPYKRLTGVIDAFRSLPDPSLRLLIAGRPVDEREASNLRREASRDQRVILVLRHIPDDQIPVLHGAADAAVIGYEEVFSSGAMLLALSYGLPVIAPRRGEPSGITWPGALETFEPGRLANAMERARRGDAGLRTRAALEGAQSFPWTASAHRTLGIYLEARSAGR